MDESGGSGRPRPGNDESAEHHAAPAAPAPDPARPNPAPKRTGTDETTPPDEPTMVVRRLDAPQGENTGDAATDSDAEGHQAQVQGHEAKDHEAKGPVAGSHEVSGHEAGRHEGSRPAESGTGATAPRADGPEAQGAAAAGLPPHRPEAAGSPPHGPEAQGSGSQAAADLGSEAKAPAEPGGDAEAPAPQGSGAHGSAERGQDPWGTEAQVPAGQARDAGAGDPAPAATPHSGEAPHHGTSAGDRTLARSGLAKGRQPRRPREPGPGGGLLMGRPFGVPVYVAPSWFLVAALITWVFGGQLDRVLPELGAARYLVSLFFAVAFYASVLIHELAHTVAALRFKLPVRRIQLQFFGGVSEIEKEAETPGREFWLAFVGPLLSLVLSGLFYLALLPVEPGTVPGVLLAGLMISNLIVAAFNLLPGLPLDGGRMLRAVVWKITGKPMSGTIAAAWVGRALAVCVLIGLPLLTQSGALGSNAEDNVGMDTVMDALLAAILAAIIWTGAGNSLRMARLREHLPELRARNLTRRAVPVETNTPLSEALRRANAAGARALVVVDADGNPLSLVREAAIVGVPEHRRPWVAVSGLAQDLTEGMRVSAELAGEDLLDALRTTPATEYLVVEETGEIYGVLSAADVERAFVKAMARPS
ncbi:site-2 protease family protein [Streptomyces sp. AC555_RSS877]|uniref:site-2 protease family protein n=1 Tax=Streptomyces sp. AC555_RSS877 TaxID=2823688 RepID=UPI001C25E5B8|nr:site-2 protease family protein [Streptomyces sp. AC555_RSS877]